MEGRLRRATSTGVAARLVLATALVPMTLGGQVNEAGDPPGRLVEIEERNIHVLCTGAGSPGVILEAGASSFAIDWALVQREVERSTRVCSYDRAWHGWSDPAPGVLGATTIRDLKAIIPSMGLSGPFVLVGASAGGLYVREYQAAYPEDVAGLVLVDPASETASLHWSMADQS